MSGFSDLSPEAQRYSRRIRENRNCIEDRVTELEHEIKVLEAKYESLWDRVDQISEFNSYLIERFKLRESDSTT